MTHSLPTSIVQLRDAIEKFGVKSPQQAKELLEDFEISKADATAWQDFEHPATDGYGRKLILQGDRYELMVMSWVPGDFSAIHDHGSTQWGAVKFLGDALHRTFEISKDNALVTTSEEMISQGSVNAVDHALIHQMGNVGGERFCSIHLYGCFEKTPVITGDARIFDLFERKIQFTDGGVFFCLPESDIKRRIEGVTADDSTLITHHRLMLDRLQRATQQAALSTSLRARIEQLEDEIRRLTSSVKA